MKLPSSFSIAFGILFLGLSSVQGITPTPTPSPTPTPTPTPVPPPIKDKVGLIYSNQWISSTAPGLTAPQPDICDISVTVFSGGLQKPGLYYLAYPMEFLPAFRKVYTLNIGANGTILSTNDPTDTGTSTTFRRFSYTYEAPAPDVTTEDREVMELRTWQVDGHDYPPVPFQAQAQSIEFDTALKFNWFFTDGTSPPHPLATVRTWYSETPSGPPFPHYRVPERPKANLYFFLNPEVYKNPPSAAKSPGKGPGAGTPGGGGNGGAGGGGGGKKDDCGMAVSSFYLRLASLALSDTPVGYTPPRGEPIYFQLNYNQIGGDHDPYRSLHSHVGPNWTFNWLTYISGKPSENGFSATRYVAGGGQEIYSGGGFATTHATGSSTVDESQVIFPVESDSGARLVWKKNPECYERTLADGTVELYEKIVDSAPLDFETLTPASAQIMAGRQYYLTKVTNPQGNITEYAYAASAGSAKLLEIKDPQGLRTRLAYEGSDPLRITKVTDPYGRSAKLTYMGSGQLASITDVIGITSSFAYGSNNFINTLTTPYGQTTFTTEEGAGYRILEITDPQGDKQRVEYRDEVSTTLVSATETHAPSGTGLTFNNSNLNKYNSFYWDRKAMKHAEIEGNSLTSAAFYQKARITHWALGPNGIAGHIASSRKAPLQNREWYNFQDQDDPDLLDPDALARVSAVARVLPDFSTQVSKFEYNEIGKLSKAIDPLGRETAYEYAANLIDLRFIKQKNDTAYETLTEITYSTAHLPHVITGANGETATYTYNSHGQPETVTNAKSEVTTSVYDSAGFLTEINGPLAGNADKTTFTYDTINSKKLNRVKTVTDSEGYTVTMDYDAFGRPVKTAYPDSTYEQTIYYLLDPQWRRDREGRWSKTVYNSIQELVQSIDPLGRSTLYEWCKCGSLQKLTDANGNITQWKYNVAGQLVEKKYADNSVISYYDEIGRLETQTDAKDQVTHYTYYDDNALEEVSYTNAEHATPSVEYEYDPAYPRVSKRTDGAGETNFTYYPVNGAVGAGKLFQEDGPLANDVITIVYDELDRIIGKSVNSVAQTVEYDVLGRITETVNPLGTFDYHYVNATGRVDSVDYPNGQVVDYDYFNNAGDQRLKQIKNLDSSSAVISQFDYEYTAAGNIKKWTQKQGAAPSVYYDLGYDLADQLTAAPKKLTSNNSVVTNNRYNYDKAGNRLSEQIDTTTKTATFNNLNQLDSITGGGRTRVAGTVTEPATVTVNGQAAQVDGSNRYEAFVSLPQGTNTVSIVATDLNSNVTSKNYQIVKDSAASRTPDYDDNGNMTDDDDGRTYQWDAANRLIKITQGANEYDFVYNGLGQRVTEKLNGTVIKRFVWCGGTQPCEERDASNAVVKRYYAQGEQVGGTAYFYTHDHLGSVRELTNTANAVQARYDFDPYGRRSKLSGSLDTSVGYTGHHHHVTGLVQTWHRFYDPELGKWLNRDPIGEEGGINLYQYCHNNPINWIDPLGLYNWPAFNSCYQKCLYESYGGNFDSIDELGYIGWANFGKALAEELSTGIVDRGVQAVINFDNISGYNVTGARAGGTIINRMSAADEGVRLATSLGKKRLYLAAASKLTGVVGLTATGLSLAARYICAERCRHCLFK
jgi:RHS repeat-associated protein